MAKPKLTLQDLQVKSIVTSLEQQQMLEVKGGIYTIRGRVHRYQTRWTSVDTRAELGNAMTNNSSIND